MKVVSSLKSLKKRDINCKVVRRRGKLYVINKKNPKFKARQGQSWVQWTLIRKKKLGLILKS